MNLRKDTDQYTPPTYSEFYDPRLVAIYDTICPIDSYQSFYLDLASRLFASTIIDIGCGSGLLTYELAKQGHHLIGVEPSALMLALARRRYYPQPVTWIHGDALSLPHLNADLAIMTGHVAQFFLDDQSWHAALTAIHNALKPGGHLAFEARNPLVQPWLVPSTPHHVDWPTQTSPRHVTDPLSGPIQWWTNLLHVHGDVARYEIHYLFTNSGEELISTNDLRFPTRSHFQQSLARAGFSTQAIFGDWDRRPATPQTPEMIFLATRP